MYKVRYITTSEVTAVRYVFDEKEIEAADDADAIANAQRRLILRLPWISCRAKVMIGRF